ncbi:ATP-binding protein [Actinocorallia longicatena]|uniref:Orc1-like AAA ATPase domain-containing protein n=1 Tax=Actinocorallia longicatena TaxID=111803 RepID=A0ABP6Q5K8_9ACTN
MDANNITGGVFFAPVIMGRDVTVMLPPEITPAMAGLPPAVASFTGRDAELADVLAFLEEEGGPSAIAVSGMGGVGKTEVAVQAARTALGRGWFPGGVLFVDMSGYDDDRALSPAQALDGLLRALGLPPEYIPDTEQDRARIFRSVLDAYAGQDRRVLLVIDNVSRMDQCRSLLPGDGRTRAIITSRESLGMLGGPLVDLDALGDEDGAEVLRRAVGVARRGDVRLVRAAKDAVRLSRLCGGLPLALQIVAALLAENAVRTPASVIDELREEHTRLGRLSHPDVELRAVFELSYRRLAEPLRRLLALLPVNPGPDVSTGAVAALAVLDEVDAARALTELARAHLIEPGTTAGRWRLHDLVRLFARQAPIDPPGGRDTALDHLLLHYLRHAASANLHLDGAATAPTVPFSDREHALEWLDAEYPNLTAAAKTAGATGRDSLARDFPGVLWDYFILRRAFKEWEALSAASALAARRLGDLQGEASALVQKGFAQTDQRSFAEAETTLDEALRIYRRIGDRNGEAVALDGLGGVHALSRRFAEALDAHERAARLHADRGDRHAHALARVNAAVALMELGRIEEALAALEGTDAVFRERGDSSNEAAALTNRGVILRELGRAEEAVEAHRGALRLYRDLEKRFDEGRALNNLGRALVTAGRVDEAVPAHRQAVWAFDETDAEYHKGTALQNLGVALQRIPERREEALEIHRQAERIYRGTGDSHPLAQVLLNAGLVERALGRFEAGRRSLIEAANLFRGCGDEESAAHALRQFEPDAPGTAADTAADRSRNMGIFSRRNDRDRDRAPGGIVVDGALVGRVDALMEQYSKAVGSDPATRAAVLAIAAEAGIRRFEDLIRNPDLVQRPWRILEAVAVHPGTGPVLVGRIFMVAVLWNSLTENWSATDFMELPLNPCPEGVERTVAAAALTALRSLPADQAIMENETGATTVETLAELAAQRAG